MPDVESNIKINITATQNQSANNIKKVDSALQQLKQTVDELQGSGLSSATNELAKLVSVLNRIDVSQANAVNVLANGLKSLATVGNVDVNVQGVPQATQEAEQGSQAMNRFAGAVQGVKTVLTTLAKPITTSDIWKKAIDQTDVQKTKDLVNGVVQGIGQIVGVTKEIPSEKFHSMATGMEQVGQKAADINKTTVAVGELSNETETVADRFAQTDVLSFANSISQTELLEKKLELATARLNGLQSAGKEGSKEWVSAVESVQRYSNALEKVKETSDQDTTKQKVQETGEEAQKATGFFEEFGKKIKEAASSQTAQQFDGLAAKIGGLATPLGAINAALSGIKLAFSYIKFLAQGAVIAVKGVAKAIATLTKLFVKFNIILGKIVVAAGKAFGSLMLAPIKMLGKAIGNVVGKLKEMLSGLIRIATYRLFRTTIKMITAGLKEGIDNLYQWSKALDQSFSKAMDLFATDKQYLNNSLAAMLEPIIEGLMPILDKAVDMLVDFFNAFNQFTSALTGKSTWTKAKKQPIEYAEAAEEATEKTKELQRTLLGFDEINRLNGDKSDSSKKDKSEKDYASMFEELPLNSVFGDLGKQIKELIENGEWYAAGAVLGRKLNELLETWDAEKTGKIIATKINQAVDFARGFLTTADWRKLGNRVANLVNGLFRNIKFRNIGKVIANVLNAAFRSALGFLETVDGKAIGKGLSDIVNGFFEELDWKAIGDTIHTGLVTALDVGIAFFDNLDSTQIYDGILDALDRINWEQLGNRVATLFNSALSVIDPAKIGQIFLNVISGVSDFIINSVGNMDIAGLVTKFTDLLRTLFSDKETIQKIATAVETMLTKAIEAVSTFFKTYPTTELFTAITTFFDGIGWDDIGSGIGTALQNAIDGIDPNTIAGAISTAINSAIKLLGSVTDKLSEMTTITLDTEVDENGIETTKTKLVTYWEKLGYDIGDALTKALNNIEWSKAGETLNNLLVGITSMIKAAFDRLAEDKELQNNIDNLLDSIDWDTIATNIAIIIADEQTAIAKAFKKLGNAMGKVLLDAILDSFSLMPDWLQDWLNRLSEHPVTFDSTTGYSSFYASGGYPTEGQAFVAREAGPELVGTIGGKTAVANNDDIVASVSAGVYEAVSAAQGSGTSNISVSVDGDNLFNFFVAKHNGTVKQTGVSPLYV